MFCGGTGAQKRHTTSPTMVTERCFGRKIMTVAEERHEGSLTGRPTKGHERRTDKPEMPSIRAFRWSSPLVVLVRYVTNHAGPAGTHQEFERRWQSACQGPRATPEKRNRADNDPARRAEGWIGTAARPADRSGRVLPEPSPPRCAPPGIVAGRGEKKFFIIRGPAPGENSWRADVLLGHPCPRNFLSTPSEGPAFIWGPCAHGPNIFRARSMGLGRPRPLVDRHDHGTLHRLGEGSSALRCRAITRPEHPGPGLSEIGRVEEGHRDGA